MQSLCFLDNKDGVEGYVGFTDRGVGRLLGGYDTDYPPYEDAGAVRYMDQVSCNYFAVNPKDPDHIIYITGHTGHDEKTCFAETKDGFKTSRLIEETGSQGFSRVFWHPTKTNIVYAGSMISYDSGETWQSIDRVVWGISPTDGDVIYGAGPKENNYTSLYVSLDRGTNWIPLNVSVYDIRCVFADMFEPYVFWVGSRGLYRIDCYNGTAKFYGSDKGFPIFSGRVMQVSSFAQDPNCREHLILAGRDSVGNTLIQSIYESWDYGETWEVVDGLPTFISGATVLFHPKKPLVYLGTGMGTLVYEFENYKKYHNSQNIDN